MSVLYTRAVSSSVQFCGGDDENANPGSEGMMMSNETFLPVDVLACWVRSLMMGRNSRNEPGQPWHRSNGIAVGSLDFSWMKWIWRPSIVTA